ncbi:hypothetical protein ACIGCP_09980 [Cellulophaga baltica]|uniref:hypothetical protein n=1 Tax=Cellulophaga baltica TaxID=76594 RepID=UPI0037C7373B
MSKRDFFRVIFKLFGLYSVTLTVFNYLPTSFSYVAYEFEPIIMLWILSAMALAIGFYVLLIRKTDKVLDWLQIDKGFDDERIEIGNFNGLGIVKLALIIIGGFLIIDYLPSFLNYTYLAFKKEVSPNGLNLMESPGNFGQLDYFQWTLSGLNLILGITILNNYNRIGIWLDKKNNVG